jgi:REP element-mobilizing transposase RayT
MERRKIFLSDEDRDDLLDRLSVLLPQTGTACCAWALIPNHAHFLFITGVVPLATLMRRLLTGYAVRFNHRHHRRGKLFENRYKSIICQEDSYLKELVRYIHLNPLRAGIVRDLEELNGYPYCGHSALMARTERPWQKTDHVLSHFGGAARSARKSYLNYLEAGIEQGRRDDLTGGGLVRSLGGWTEVRNLTAKSLINIMSDERILGESDFVESILARANESCERRSELQRLGFDLVRIAERVAKIRGMKADDVLSTGRQKQKVEARNLLCYWAVRECGMSLRDLARRLKMTGPGVGFAVQRGEALVRVKGYRLVE